jgi:hypothetical protein
MSSRVSFPARPSTSTACRQPDCTKNRRGKRARSTAAAALESELDAAAFLCPAELD